MLAKINCLLMQKPCQPRGNKSRDAINLKVKITSTPIGVVQLPLLYGFWTDSVGLEGDTLHLKPLPAVAGSISYFAI